VYTQLHYFHFSLFPLCLLTVHNKKSEQVWAKTGGFSPKPHSHHLNKLSGKPPQYATAPTGWPLTLKVMSESCVLPLCQCWSS